MRTSIVVTIVSSLILILVGVLVTVIVLSKHSDNTVSPSPVEVTPTPTPSPQVVFSANTLTAAQQFAIDNKFVNGVNLGGWLIMETSSGYTSWPPILENGGYGGWMFDQPEMFADSQLDWITKLRATNDNHAIQSQVNHWKGYITDDLLNKLPDVGITSVRIPVGYWIFETPIGGTTMYDIGFQQEGFVTGGIQYLENVLEKLHGLNINVMIDLHAVAGCSTVCQSYAGVSCSSDNWFWEGSAPNISRCNGGEYTGTRAATPWKSIIQGTWSTIATWIVAMNEKFGYNIIYAFELINEPALGTPGGENEAYKTLLMDNIPNLQKVLHQSQGGPVAIILNFIDGNFDGSGTFVKEQLQKDWKLPLYIDYHRYFNFQNMATTASPWYVKICSEDCCSDYENMYLNNGLKTMIGEWSAAVEFNNPDLSCPLHPEIAKVIYSNQLANFFALRKINDNFMGHYFWSARQGSGWVAVPTSDHPDGHQVDGTSFDTSQSKYPYCSWSLSEMIRLNIVEPIDKMGLTGNGRCGCTNCQSV
jgi:hypothetical protein